MDITDSVESRRAEDWFGDGILGITDSVECSLSGGLFGDGV